MNHLLDDESGCSSSDSTTGESCSPEYTGCFEGPEKTMEVVFRPDRGVENGLRALTRAQLDTLCKKAKCTIISEASNQHIDAYVLSESSLFIYKHRYIMKTCGTTTLLRCLSTLLEYADALGMELTWVGYSRKNLLFPSAQLWPHSSFGDEIRYIDSHEHLQNRLKGQGYILGPITGDHWFVYVADHSHTSQLKSISSGRYTPPNPTNERTINMMMFDMAPEVAEIFYKENTATGKEMTMKSGIVNLCPGALIDETAFTPCGYSMNAILHDAYSTIHITPEPSCSYASFETNTCLNSYSAMVRNVLSVFRPKRFVLTMFGDQSAIDNIPNLPTDAKFIYLPGSGDYLRTSVSSTKVDLDLCCLMACYTFDQQPVISSRGRNESNSTLSSSENCNNVPPPSMMKKGKSELNFVAIKKKNSCDGVVEEEKNTIDDLTSNSLSNLNLNNNTTNNNNKDVFAVKSRSRKERGYSLF
jgi:S-adenosylmethionine decarboxylase